MSCIFCRVFDPELSNDPAMARGLTEKEQEELEQYHLKLYREYWKDKRS